MGNETINTSLITRYTVDYEEYKIEQPTETPLVREYKGVHRDLVDKLSQIDSAIPVAGTLTSKKDLLPVPLLVYRQSSPQKF